MAELALHHVTDGSGAVVAPEWLTRAEQVHRQLRARLPENYVERLTEVFANGGRMLVAASGDAVVGVALWRLVENTHEGRRLYVEDLVVDTAARSGGVGGILIETLQSMAHEKGCQVIALDSGVQRAGAHRFYFREGFSISSYSFRKSLT